MAALMYTRWDFLKEIAKALGLEGRPVKRVVIDIRVDDVAHVYIDEFLQDVSADSLLLALAASTTHGHIAAPPLPSTEPPTNG